MAGTVAVPQLFEDLIDECSSCSDSHSDAHGVVRENSFPFSKDLVRRVISDLEYSDMVSILFLLTDDLSDVFHKLLRLHSCGAVLMEWLMSQKDGCWENKLIESLCIIQNYQVLGCLVPDVTSEKTRFAPRSPECSLFVNCIRKCLYLVCEALSAEELEEMVHQVREKCPNMDRTFPCEFMELYFMYWTSCHCISVGRQVNLTVLKSVLKSMNKLHLVMNLESSERAMMGWIHRMDGPYPLDISGCRRLHVNHRLNTCTRRPPSHDVYDKDPDNMGVCLIINQKMFYREPDPRLQWRQVNEDKTLEQRVGTDVDRDRLWEIFHSMGFKVYVEENLTHEYMLKAVEMTVRKMDTKHSCFVLCILSHGDEGIVFGSNSVAVRKEELEDLLLKAPNLRGKPKLMILQVCQGERLQNVVYCNDVVTDGPVLCSIGESADLLTFWATVPGYASLRHHIDGSWFVEALWQVLMSTRTDEDIATLFTRVTNVVTRRCHFLEGGYKTMVPQQCTTLRKILVLPQHPRFKMEVSLAMYRRFLLEDLIREYIERLKQRCLEL